MEFLADLDWGRYWFMFPVSMGVATTAMLSGIGGAALFAPIFLIIFPILGSEYVLAGTAAAIGTALMTEVFGFSSGFVGYYRKKLIHFRSAYPFLIVALPVAVVGALLLATLQHQEALLKAAYALLMLILAPIIFRHQSSQGMGATTIEAAKGPGGELVRVAAADGQIYEFKKPRQGMGGGATTGVGSFLTGLLGVGVGEVIMPQLVKRNRVPLPVAAATSVFIVIVTIAAASFTQVSALIAAGGANAIPWNLVCYTIPGVIIGGQIGPRLQGKISQRTMEKTIATLFAIIGLAMGFIALRELGLFGV
ncbi:MAG TPA: hypothetical protein DIT35_04125 [Rhodospirillaceae bacterium]|nr:hypothetical protein [Rhodospirillaceae bacterium]